MAFRGVYPAPDLVTAPCGILSVARVMTHTSRQYDERWVRGFSHEYDSLPTVRLLSEDGSSVQGWTNETDYKDYLDYKPFFIELESFQSTFGLPGEDRFAQVKKQLEAATQRAIEYELWSGDVAVDDDNGNLFLTKSSAAQIAVAGAHTAEKALFHLEQAVSNAPIGQKCVIHMTRDVASILGSRLIYVSTDEGKSGRAMTRLGTDVIIGTGYTGDGPIGDANAEASATNRWMFVTGPVDIHIGKIEIVNENLGQGVDATINNMRIKALRPAAVYFDPATHYAIRVEVPSTT
jgi:hypothetical protein